MKGLDSAQVEQLRQIGEYLHHLREQQSTSLEEIAKNTFIPLRLLEAIEVADINRLPEPVYVKGFIRRYADALGVNGTEIADAFPIDIYPSPPPPEENQNEVETKQPDYGSTYLSSSQNHPTRSFIPYLPYAAAGVIAVVAVGAIAIGASNAFRSNSPQKAEPQNTSNNISAPVESAKPSQATNSSGNSSPNSNSTAKATKPSNTASAGPVEVDVTLANDSWMEVVIDDNVEFEGMLAKGEQRNWTGQKSIEIRAGNAGGVLVSHNQGEAKPLGKLGEVVDVSFTNQQNPQDQAETVSQQ